jgi:hypothetical protein
MYIAEREGIAAAVTAAASAARSLLLLVLLLVPLTPSKCSDLERADVIAGREGIAAAVTAAASAADAIDVLGLGRSGKVILHRVVTVSSINKK